MSSTSRRHVEEQMTQAFLDESCCNSCGRAYIKEDGCNHIKCSICGNEQCHICKENIKGYLHFDNSDNSNNSTCDLYDDEKRRKRLHDKVTAAESSAIKRLLSQEPSISPEKLTVTDTKGKAPALPVQPKSRSTIEREKEARKLQTKAREIVETGLTKLFLDKLRNEYRLQGTEST